MREIDVAIIGGGTAGMTAYRKATQHTDQVLLIEGGQWGTTCARIGCMPSKLLIAAAEQARLAREAHRFGIHVPEVRVDGPAVMARVRGERDRFVGAVLKTIEQIPAGQRLEAQARFVDAHTLALSDGTQLRARRIVIATGSRPQIPEGWREQLGDRLILSEDVFYWNDLPESVAIVGTGIIGLELAQALHSLGVRVRLFGRNDRVGPLSDPDLQAHARTLIGARLPLTLNARELSVQRIGDEVQVDYTQDGESRSERFSLLLAATGRVPNLDNLSLAASGVQLNDKGLPTFDPHTGQIGDSHLFIAGDVTNDKPLLHEAAALGKIAGDNAGRHPDIRRHPRTVALAVAFSDPQIAMVGQSHAALKKAGIDFAAGSIDFAKQGRSRVMYVNAGLLHVYGERDGGRFVGAEMIGPGAEHVAHLLAWSLQQGMTVQQMVDQPYYHPVIEEGVRTALQALLRNLQMGPKPEAQCLDCGPGA